MTLKYFQGLSEQKQYRRLLTEGICVGERRHENMLVLLFQLYDFYTEVYFHEDTNELVGSRSFGNTEDLHPYLTEINLGVLMN